jgi:hypothetical protein
VRDAITARRAGGGVFIPSHQTSLSSHLLPLNVEGSPSPTRQLLTSSSSRSGNCVCFLEDQSGSEGDESFVSVNMRYACTVFALIANIDEPPMRTRGLPMIW